MNKNRIFLILISILFTIMTISYVFINITQNKYKIIIIIVIYGIILTSLSLYPYLKKYLKYKNKQKNNLSDLTFTDRKEDILNVIKILTKIENTVEIKSMEHGTGKTWLAQKICDEINNNNIYENIKIPFCQANYFDMDKSSEDDINRFLENNSINKRVVLIFDHVENLEMLLSKQEYYHFNMIYIMKENTSISDFNLNCHNISDFNQCYISELQNKITQKYTSITSISSKEIEVLYNITSGNIKKIHEILSRKRYIDWLKQISNCEMTDYDIELNAIQTELYVGNYQTADVKLEEFYFRFKAFLENNKDLFFKYYMMKSDCLHLLNRYEEAVVTISPLTTIEYKFINKNSTVELFLAHFYKHLWDCEKSISILKNIELENVNGLIASLGIYSTQYFIDESLSKSANALIDLNNTFARIQNRMSECKTEDQLVKIKFYSTIVKFYQKVQSAVLYEIINDVINTYNAQNNRLIANAYFIKGEIYRLDNDFVSAIKYYEKCQSVTNDNNIKIQVAIMIYYLKNIKKVDQKYYSYKTLDEIQAMCCDQTGVTNNYGIKLVKLIRCIELEDTNAPIVKNNFESRIMVIL